jgi:hypothetical protein
VAKADRGKQAEEGEITDQSLPEGGSMWSGLKRCRLFLAGKVGGGFQGYWTDDQGPACTGRSGAAGGFRHWKMLQGTMHGKDEGLLRNLLGEFCYRSWFQMRSCNRFLEKEMQSWGLYLRENCLRKNRVSRCGEGGITWFKVVQIILKFGWCLSSFCAAYNRISDAGWLIINSSGGWEVQNWFAGI